MSERFCVIQFRTEATFHLPNTLDVFAMTLSSFVVDMSLILLQLRLFVARHSDNDVSNLS